MFQIHIGGPKRAGKTTLARGLTANLMEHNLRPALVDVDEVRTEIFGSLTGAPDSEESLKYHLWTISAIYNAIIPRLLKAVGSPITVAGHSRRDQYDRAVEISEKHGSRLKFLIVEAPTLEEAAERARHMSEDDRSDMRDFTDPNIRASFEKSAARITDLYSTIRDPRIHRIRQGTYNEMLEQALKAVWRRD